MSTLTSQLVASTIDTILERDWKRTLLHGHSIKEATQVLRRAPVLIHWLPLASIEKWVNLGIFSLLKRTSADLSRLFKLPMQKSDA